MQLFGPLDRMIGVSQSNLVVTRLGGLASLGDSELLAVMKRLSAAERTLSVYALAHLGEIQRRKLHEDAGFPSMFAYCVGALHYSEAMAYRRLQAATAASKFPEVLTMIKDGCLSICALSMIAKHLTRENSSQLLHRIEGKSARVVLRLTAELKPLPDTADRVRSLPPSLAAPPVSAAPPVPIPPPSLPVEPSIPAVILPVGKAAPVFASQRIMPRSPDRVQFSFTGSEELWRVIDRCSELLWHKHPDGRLENILLEVGRSYLELKDPALIPPSKPKPPRSVETRTVPRWVRSAVYRRDAGRCVFMSAEGRRCEARRSLEYDHIQPWSKGGRSDDPTNIRLLCRAHNQWAASTAGLT